MGSDTPISIDEWRQQHALPSWLHNRVVLPVRPGSKQTHVPDWANPDLDPSTITRHPGDNLALRLDSPLADVEGDCAEWRKLAPRFLAPTATFGRESDGHAGHWVYRVDGAKPFKFKDVNASVLGEIRTGCGYYSVVKGRYPRRDDPTQSEIIQFANDREPIGFDATGLYDRARLLAVTCLLARAWPAASRHNAVLAICGTLVNLGLDEADTLKVVESLTLCAEGEIWTDCGPAARSTYSAKKDGKSFTAATELASLLGANGPEVVKRIHKWFGAEGRKAVIVGAESYTDAGSAEFFARTQGDRLRFDERQERWLRLNDAGIWAPCTDAALIPVAIDVTRERQRLAVEVTDRALRDQALRWVRGAENRGALSNMVALARGLPPIRDDGDSWDTIPYLLGVPNGVVDLRTGELRAAQPDERITMRASIDYDPDARSELWERTLAEVFPDPGLPEFVQLWFGYCATGETNLDRWTLHEGPKGRNGKGTICGAVYGALGDYVVELPAANFDQRQQGAPYDLAKLPGKRIMTCSEAGDSIKIHHDRLKQITGGDKLRAADKYEKSFEFFPVAKPNMACNRLPKVLDDSEAFWARTLVIPYKVTFRGRENTTLRDTLRKDPAQQRAILAWVVQGAMRYYANGQTLGTLPACITSASDRFRDVSSRLHDFYEARCEILAGAKVKASDLHNAYRQWATRNTHFALGSKSFYQEVERRFEKKVAKDGNWYLGLGLRDCRDDEADGPADRELAF